MEIIFEGERWTCQMKTKIHADKKYYRNIYGVFGTQMKERLM